MSATVSRIPRIAAVAAALSLGALALPASAHADGDRVMGSISSVAGNTFEVSRPDGSATVAFSDATTVSEAVPAQLVDVTVGSCIKAGPTPESGPADSGAITAKWVLISTAVDGKCAQRPGSGPHPASAPHRPLRGVVDAVTGNAVSITSTNDDGTTTPATVTVTDTTSYKRRVPADPAAIAVGKCVAARGATDDNGVLQATRVTVWPARDGGCPHPAAQ